LNQLTPEYEMYGDSMRYGRAIKESVLKRVLPPNAESIRSVSVDVRIAEQTIRNWIAKVDQGILGDDVQLGPRQLGAPEKFALLLEAAGLKEDERGPWIREKGLHTEHLQLWQQELRDTVAEKSNKDLEMASRIPPFVAIKRDPPGEKNYLSFFSEILYDTPSREKTCA
jgi:transposase-like protein